jgi:hypothetical protein
MGAMIIGKVREESFKMDMERSQERAGYFDFGWIFGRLDGEYLSHLVSERECEKIFFFA